MSMFDTLLKNIGGAPDDVANLASQLGIDPEMAEKAIAALGQAHQMEGDTVKAAAASTGLSSSVLNQIVEAIGGEGSLMEFANMLDRDGDGNPLNDVAGIAKNLFGNS